jgi:Zn-dependent protease
VKRLPKQPQQPLAELLEKAANVMRRFIVPLRIDRKGWQVVTLCFLFEITLHAFSLGLAAGALLVICLLLHEVGHVAAATAFGVPVREFGICAYGAYTRRARSDRRRDEIMISFAGPLMNLLLAVPIILLPKIGIQLAFCNLTLFAVNLLPISSSDGSRILDLIRNPKRALSVAPTEIQLE